jgi:nucleotide-binding universal stress UspA family protein
MEWVADLPTWHAAISDQQDDYREEGRRELEAEFEEAVPADNQPPIVELEVALEFPEEYISEELERADYGLVAIGATGLNRVANFFLGSVPEEIVRRSAAPVMVVPHDDEPGGLFENIVAPVDFSKCSRKSLAHAAGLAREADASLTVVHADSVAADTQSVPMSAAPEAVPVEEIQEKRSEQFEKFLEEAHLEGLDWESRQQVGSPLDVISDTVEEIGADLVVMGTHGRRGLERLFLGSTATKVLRRMPCAVVTVRELDGDEEE